MTTLFAPLLAEVNYRAVPYFAIIGLCAMSIVSSGLIRVKYKGQWDQIDN